jgi:hypothetical protein
MAKTNPAAPVRVIEETPACWRVVFEYPPFNIKDEGRARFTAHTSFDDPNSPPNAAPRESIEVRALVFWPADQ